jgi:hypothetical protein
MSISNGVDGQPAKHLRTVREFDYASLPSEAATFLKAQVRRIHRQAAISIIGIGRDLILAKRYLSHGLFVNWVEVEVGIPARTAQAYMQAAHWSAAHKTATVALLPPSVLYLLSSPRTPESFIADVLRRIESGEKITVPAIRKELKRLKETGIEQKAEHVEAAVEWKQQNCSIMIASSPAEAVRRAVTILARRLSANDFAEVRQILTSEIVLRDPALGKTLAAALAEWNTTDSVERAA